MYIYGISTLFFQKLLQNVMLTLHKISTFCVVDKLLEIFGLLKEEICLRALNS